MDMDLCQDANIISKVRQDDAYAQNFYAALCNNTFQEHDIWQILRGKTWSCSWRTASGIIADIRGQGDYANWYCSGISIWAESDGYRPSANEHRYVPEGMITEEIRHDLAQIGWIPVDQNTNL